MRNTYRNTSLELQRRITKSAPAILGAVLVFVVATFAALSFVSLLGACGAADAGGRTSGNSFSAAIYVQGNPNGKVTAQKGTIGVDERTTTVYQNTNGAKAWSLLAASAGVGDIDSVTAGEGLVGGGASGDVTLDVGCGFGLSCAPDEVDLRDDCQAGDYLVFTSFGESGNRWQCANDAGSHKLVRDVVATTNGGLATTLDTTDPTAFAEFVHLRKDCANGEVLKSGASGATWSCSADSGGITNSAGNNIVMKSDGTNAVASRLTDNGTTLVIGTHMTVADSALTPGNAAWAISSAGVFTGTHTGAHNVTTMQGSGSAPTVASGCGTGPSVDTKTTNMGGEFTTGTSPGVCILNFSATFGAAPWCQAMQAAGTTLLAPNNVTTTTTQASFNGVAASTKYRFWCAPGR